MGVQGLSGAVFLGYELEECLGFSSHSAVYRATGPGSGTWAVKVVDGDLEPDGALADRLRREADLLSHMDRPEVLPTLHAARHDAGTFAASPLLAAPTLRSLMDEGSIEDDLAWSLLCQLADALDSMHGRGLIHGGLKPINILVEDGQRVRLAEFGIHSRWTGRLALTANDYRLADPYYLAPEVVRGEPPDGRADVYALGVLAFELLTGRPPVARRRAADVLRTSLTSPAPAPRTYRPELPEGVDVVLGRALARDRQDRYRSAAELIDQLIELPSARAAAPVVRAAPQPESAAGLMERLGMPVRQAHDNLLLNAFYATAVRACARAVRDRWTDVVRATELDRYLIEAPPDDSRRTSTVESLNQLGAGIEAVYGDAAAAILQEWGRLTLEDWLASTQRKPFRMRGRPDQRLRDTLYVLTRTLDRVRGAELHTWREFDRRHFWLAYQHNLFADGRTRSDRPCHFAVGGLESALRWGGLINDWRVEEVECGRVTGSGTCVLSIEYRGKDKHGGEPSSV
ncbi:MAG: serine/threonine protein kinase [Candidatus Dormibacteraeota bacterium]|nr:serine/threonine protein kinase [Candidatus Dormibacteraeota bacterium]